MAFDWKFLVTILVAISGVLVSLWIGQGDHRARSLSLRLASSVALQPSGTTAIPDLQISINGVKVESPFLSTLELKNDGSKPIPAGDFESSIELSVGPDAKVVRARVSGTEPKDVKAELETSIESIKIRPLLLNPQDTLTIVVITSGSPPVFIPRARIAGISKITFEDATVRKSNWMAAIALAAIALLAALLYFAYAATIARPGALRLSRALSLSTMLCCLVANTLALRGSFEAVGTEFNRSNSLPTSLVLLVLGAAVYWYLIRKARRQSTINAD